MYRVIKLQSISAWTFPEHYGPFTASPVKSAIIPHSRV